MDAEQKLVVSNQFGAAIAMLENAIRACPETLWDAPAHAPESRFWYLAYHTLFWLDYYVSDRPDGYAPPPPYGLEEMDPAGVLPPRTYSRDELLAFLEHGRARARARIAALTADTARAKLAFNRFDLTVAELMVYSLRHVQHHAAQLNLLLRQNGVAAPRWVGQA